MARTLTRVEKAPKAEKPEKKKETPAEFISSSAVIIVVALFIITFNLQAFEIPSSSMENTLLIGDHLFVDRVLEAPKTSWFPIIPYRQIKRHDIVVFVSPAQPGLYLVKRIIGLPGDHVLLKDGVLYLNGVRQDEPYVIHDGSYNPYRDNFPSVPPVIGQVTQEWHLLMPNYVKDGELEVPPDRFFAMGDNRDVSYDSRYWGFIPRENIIGRPMFIYWSFNTPPNQYAKTGLADRAGYVFQVILHFIDQTRWRRMLHRVS